MQSEIEEVFARELEAAGPDAERLKLALIAATGWPSWELLRSDLGLTPEEVVAVMRMTCHALLDARA